MFAEELIKALEPLRVRREEFSRHPDDVWAILADGAERARILADETMADVKKKVGLP